MFKLGVIYLRKSDTNDRRNVSFEHNYVLVRYGHHGTAWIFGNEYVIDAECDIIVSNIFFR